MDRTIELDNKNIMVMKLLHYFITQKEYNPIILQGVENEIWLENLNGPYEIVRIVSNHIHNDEQYDFDIFKTKRILNKIKRKTFSFNMKVFSIYLDLEDRVTRDINEEKNVNAVSIKTEEELLKSDVIKTYFSDLKSDIDYKEEGFSLFMKITNDINKHNKEDNEKIEKVFKRKYPFITYLLIAMCVICYITPILMNVNQDVLNMFCVHGPSIRAGQYYRLLTGAFLHGNIFHLGFNCYALYVVGTQIESFLGKWKYLVIYLVSALFGSLVSMTFAGAGASIGASGAIFGILGSLIYFGYHYRVYLGNVIKSQIIPLVLLNLGIGFMFDGIDNFAHIGGLIGGIICTMALGIDGKSKTSDKINGWIIMCMFLAFIIYMGFVYVA